MHFVLLCSGYKLIYCLYYPIQMSPHLSAEQNLHQKDIYEVYQ